MDRIDSGGVALRVRIDGPDDGPPVLFLNALGTDLRLWDGVIARRPPGLRLLRYDMRGHGGSDCPAPPYAMGALVRDAERVLEAAGARNAVLVGLSLGGMVAQALAAKRLDLVRAAVLAATAPRIGTREMWEARVDAVLSGGVAALSDGIMARWFPAATRQGAAAQAARRMLEATPAEGYAGAAAAIAGTDLISPTSGLRLPVLALGGSEDGSTPPDMLREMADLIPGAEFALIRGAGHVAPIDAPEAFAARLTGFLARIGHLPARTGA